MTMLTAKSRTLVEQTDDTVPVSADSVVYGNPLVGALG